MNAVELFKVGRLSEAITSLNERLRNKPTDIDGRNMLVEFLVIANEHERADKQLDLIAHQQPQLAHGVALLRQLIRADLARQQFFIEGRLPEFASAAGEGVQCYLRAAIALREQNLSDAASQYNQAEEQRVQVKGTCNGKAFDDFRDLDDRTAAVLEVLTPNGKYFWVPFTDIKKIEFRAIERPLDIKWRRAHIELRNNGPEGEVYVSALYFSNTENKDEYKTGRMTDWIGDENQPVFGLGQKMYLVGDDAMSVSDLNEIIFE